jgi:DNA-binding IclR family transcriptional regulator
MAPSRLAEALPARLPASTAHTVTSVPELRVQLSSISRTGVAFDYEEQNDGICAAGIAVTIGGLALAVSIPMPAQRFVGRERECADALIRIRDRMESDTAL